MTFKYNPLTNRLDLVGAGGGGGAVTGTGTNNHLVRWDGTGVPAIKDGVTIETDTGELQAGDGTDEFPTYSFVNDPNSGIFRVGPNTYGFCIGGVRYFTWDINLVSGRYITDSLQVTNLADHQGALTFNSRQTATSTNILDNDCIIEVTDTTATRTITFLTPIRARQFFVIKDSSGAAATTPIVITINGGVNTIDGALTTQINTNYGAIGLYADASNNLHVMWRYNGVGSGFPWLDITTATRALAVNTGYITNRGAGVAYTLPATAIQGSIIRISGKLGLWTIAQNANQSITVGSGTSTVGVTGSIAATNAGDCIELLATTAGASTVWTAQNWVGNITVT